MTEIQNKNKIESNNKPAIETDSLDFRNDSISSTLTSTCIVANQESLSIGDIYACGPEGNRTPENLLSRKNSNHSGPTAFLLYQNL